MVKLSIFYIGNVSYPCHFNQDDPCSDHFVWTGLTKDTVTSLGLLFIWVFPVSMCLQRGSPSGHDYYGYQWQYIEQRCLKL